MRSQPAETELAEIFVLVQAMSISRSIKFGHVYYIPDLEGVLIQKHVPHRMKNASYLCNNECKRDEPDLRTNVQVNKFHKHR